MSALTNVLETVLVLASPITQEEQVSKDGEETVYLSRAQLDTLNAQDLQAALQTARGSDEWKGFFCVEPYSATPQTVLPGETQELELKIVCTESKGRGA